MSNLINIPIITSKPIILIDQSYYVFNRYYATTSWYGFQKKDCNNLENIENNTDFIMAFFRHFEGDIKKIIKKYKTVKSNIIFCADCTRCEIWRNVIYKDYKSTRMKKENFDGTIFNLFKNYISNNDFNYCESNNLEADDITYIIQKKIKEDFKNYMIVIITNDNDYLQMYDANTIIINMQFKDISLRIKTNPMIELEFKIIYGDKSDNIPKIQTGLKKNDAFKLANMSKEDRNRYLNEHNLMEKYLLNKKLVDLTEIPQKLINDFNSKYNIIKR
jgi:5'-3' exonuclease